jgi:hypothetical protein
MRDVSGEPESEKPFLDTRRGDWRLAAAGNQDWALPIALARNVAHLSSADLEDIDEYQLEGYINAAYDVIEAQARAIRKEIAELLNQAFGER